MLSLEKGNIRGKAVFTQEMNCNELDELISSEPLSWFIDDEDWDITGRQYRQIAQNKSLNYIKKLNIISLKIRWNDAKNILKQIRGISFPKLQNLCLNGNNIQNLQIFICLDLKYLKSLNLKQNNITNFKALRKCYFPQLKELLLYKNRVTRDFMALFQMYLPRLEVIWTTPQNDNFDCNQSLGWVFRLQSNNLKHLYVRHRNAQKLNVQVWKQMVTRRHVGVKLDYEIKDDIDIALQ